MRDAHANGAGNGQYVWILDFGQMGNMGLAELHQVWPYVKEAVVGIAMNYAGTCPRMYVTRTPRIFAVAWRLLRPFLTESTNAKVAIVSPRGRTPHINDYAFSPLTQMAPQSLPTFLGGALLNAEGAMHWVNGESQ